MSTVTRKHPVLSEVLVVPHLGSHRSLGRGAAPEGCRREDWDWRAGRDPHQAGTQSPTFVWHTANLTSSAKPRWRPVRRPSLASSISARAESHSTLRPPGSQVGRRLVNCLVQAIDDQVTKPDLELKESELPPHVVRFRVALVEKSPNVPADWAS